MNQLQKPDSDLAARIVGRVGYEHRLIAYRFRPGDYVPFRESIKVSYEILGHSWKTSRNPFAGSLSQQRGDDYSSVAYWYENNY